MKKKRMEVIPLNREGCKKLFFRTVELLVLLLVFHLNLNAKAFSQHQRLSLDLKEVTFEQFIAEIRQHCDVGFIYDYNSLKRVNNITIVAQDEEIASIFERALSGTGFYAEMEKNTIIIRRMVSPQAVKPGVKISGVVIDKNGEVLPGVTILIKGTTIGTTTNEQGRFDMTLPDPEGKVLVFSFIGMESQEVKINHPEQEIKVTLKANVESLNEVVVTGIYSRDKNSFTGSATTYTKKDLKMIGTQNIIQSLKTLDPAMMVLESKQWGSDPNRMPDIEIRGKTSVVGLRAEYDNDPNQPLFILDGVETTLSTIINLNMDRVESVTILKDAASTAIYGSKAANGVIVVETKQPEAGQLRVSYNGNFGIQFADLSDYNLMNSSEKLEFEKRAGRYTPISENPGYGQVVSIEELYYKRLKEVLRGVDTYWMNEPLRTVFNHSHNLYIDGGDKSMRYGLGVSYNNSNGVMKGSDRNGASVNVDLTYRNGNLLFSNKASLDITNSSREPVAFSEFSQANPYYRKELPDGTIPLYLEKGDSKTGDVFNPLYKWHIKNTNETKTLQLRDNFNVEWTLWDAFRFRGRLGLTKNISKTERFKSPRHPDFDETEKLQKGSFAQEHSESFTYDGKVDVIFGKLFHNIHQVNFVGGWSFNENKNEANGYNVVGFNDEFHTNPSFSTGFRENQKPSYSKSEKRSTSFYMNANYSYNNRYLVDFNLRADGASAFGSNKLFSTTWAVGLAWNAHNESFVKAWGWVDDLKIRASVGNPGNQNFDAFIAQKTYLYNVELQNMFGSSALIEKMGNKNLEWQRTIDKNIGADLAFWNNRIRATFDYYFKNTDPLLVSIGMPPSTGTNSIYTNLGRQISRGWTATLNCMVMKKEDLTWNVNINARRNRSKYKDIGDKLDYLNERGSSTTLNRYYEGASPDDMWAVPSLGIDPATGREVFLKKDGTQTFKYSASDEVVVGCSVPDVEGVVGTSFYYKGLSASFNFRYRLGGQTTASALYKKVENISDDQLKYNQDKRALYDRWSKPGDQAKFKSIKDQSSTPMSSRFIVTENTFSGESISVGYETTATYLRYAGIQGLTLRAYMNDIFRISSFKEERGLDYPFARSVTFSVGIRF